MSKRRAKRDRLRNQARQPLSPPAQPAQKRFTLTARGWPWWVASALTLAISAWLLFCNLGTYYFWCDEADTVIFGRGIARTGDTSGLIDHNLYGYRNGGILKQLHGRHQPPLPYYIAAPFVGKEGISNLWPRVPFAVFGMSSVVLMVWWLGRAPLPVAYRYVFLIGLVCNVSFFLFCRQCRYFSLSILLTLVVAWLYLNWNGKQWMLVTTIVASILLFATSYLAYAALYAVIGCDYLLFQRRRNRLTLVQIAILLVPQVVVGLAIVWIYNPFASAAIDPAPAGRNPLVDKLTLVWYFFRDQSVSELAPALLVLAAPVVYYWQRNVWLLRGALAYASYTLVTALIQPYPVTYSEYASVRYLCAAIPLGIAVSSLVLVIVARSRWQIAVPLAIAAFGFNVVNQPFSPDRWHCTPLQFVQEIWQPRPTPTEAAAKWINENVKPGQTIWVQPDYLQAALMYYAPQVLYAWQLQPPPQDQFVGLPPIHFVGYGMPDYFLVFGPKRELVDYAVATLREENVFYSLIKVLEVYWEDEIRPEIIWRSFEPTTKYSKQTQAIYIYRHVSERDGK